jgi:hypothetical protein
LGWVGLGWVGLGCIGEYRCTTDGNLQSFGTYGQYDLENTITAWRAIRSETRFEAMIIV